MHTHLHESTFC